LSLDCMCKTAQVDLFLSEVQFSTLALDKVRRSDFCARRCRRRNCQISCRHLAIPHRYQHQFVANTGAFESGYEKSSANIRRELNHLERGPMPNIMATQRNVRGALCWMLMIKSRKSQSGAIVERSENAAPFSATTRDAKWILHLAKFC